MSKPVKDVGRNKRIEALLTKEALEKDIRELRHLQLIADKYRLSDWTIKARLRKFGLKYKDATIFLPRKYEPIQIQRTKLLGV
jgi:hypothetical protein